MNQIVEQGKTLLVVGPAAVSVISGKAEVLGFPVNDKRRVVVREGKQLPFFITEKAVFDISLSENASFEEVEGNTIPDSWTDAAELLKGFHKRPTVAMVIGRADTGKTSFCTYLVNNLVSVKQRVAILDGDLGQSDVGPPCTVAYACVTKPLIELYELKAENAFFVGVTSPSEAVDKMIEGLALMKAEIMSKPVDFIVVNTDGWVEGEGAVQYKAQLAEKLEPDIIFCIQQRNDLSPLLETIPSKKIVVESSFAVKQRSPEKRRLLREMNYSKYLVGAKVRSLPLNQLKLEEKLVWQAKQDAGKGLLLGLYGTHRKFLGIGVLQNIDQKRRTLKILTSVSATPVSVVFGKIRLNENFKETHFSGSNVAADRS
ncbi:MAG: Clp1/GlmU family protein [Candidatus Bathyarchaeota archaeon]|nr:Clp1/GlmU family protein [Candidatus Bathyarchaeota archaeon]